MRLIRWSVAYSGDQPHHRSRGEKIRWSADSMTLKEDKIELVGNCLIASSFLSYTGSFNF